MTTWLLLAMAAAQARPVSYIIDYGAPISVDADYAQRYAAYPPDVLHLGLNAAPLPSYWFGAGGQPNPSPDQLAARAAWLKKQMAALHQVGITTIMPYLCAITIGGDPEPPLGWFAFFRDWDRYGAFGLGPKPAGSPLDWLQRRPDGQPRFFYRHDHPPYAPVHRWAISAANPSWRRFQEAVAANMAAVGCDGTFVDNPSNDDFGPGSQREFAEWVGAAVPEEIRQAAWPDGQVALSNAKGALAATITRRFFAVSMTRLLETIRQGGANGGKPDFQVNPNAAGWAEGQYRRGWDLRCMAPAIAMTMDEGAVWPGVERQVTAGPVVRQKVRDNLFSYLRGAMRGRDRVNCLAQSTQMVSDDQLHVATAAAAAFGGLWDHRFRDAPAIDGWERFVGFAKGHRELFDDLELTSEVGLAYSTPDMTADFVEHFGACRETAHLLLREQIPVRLVELTDADDAELRGYRLLILPRVRCLDDGTVTRLRAWVAAGGAVLTVGPAATHDEWGRERTRAADLPGAVALDWPTDEAGWQALRQAFAGKLPAGGSLVAESVPGLRLAAWRTADGRREVLHLLNYGVDATAGVKPRPTAPLPGFTLQLHGRRPAAARLLSPAAEPVALKVAGDRVTVPSVPLYAVVELSGVQAGPPPPPVAVAGLRPDVPELVASGAAPPRPAAPWRGRPKLEGGPTRWRFAQMALIQSSGGPLEVTVESVSEGYGGQCRAKLLSPDCRTVADATADIGRPIVLRAEASRPGDTFLVLADPGRNSVELEADAPLTVLGKNHVFDVTTRVRRLYFLVPAGVKQFTLTASANSPNETATVGVHRPDGAEAARVAGELDTDETMTIPVPPEAAGKLWSLVITKGPTGALSDVKLTFDPQIPGYLADDPSRLLLPE